MHYSNAQTVNVERAALLEKLLANRASHAAELKAAESEYRDVVRKGLAQLVAQTTAQLNAKVPGSKIPLNIRQLSGFSTLAHPESHLEEYDEVIDRMRWEVEDVVALDPQTFNCFVRDSWEWKGRFRDMRLTYLGLMDG